MNQKKILDRWTGEKIGAGKALSRERLDRYTLVKLNEIVEYAKKNSLFYSQKYDGYTVSSFEDFKELPFTTQEDLKANGMEFLCVKQSDISRIVTLQTGGTTDLPKRIYFTEEDQELTVDYFAHGMQIIATSEDVVLILMPSRAPGSIGTLLSEGIARFGASAIRYGVPQLKRNLSFEENESEFKRLIKIIEKKGVTGIVALPTQLEMLAEYVAENTTVKPLMKSLKWVLLSGEYVSKKGATLIGDAFGCKTYEHYGMTEMGLGCAVSCGYGEGYHVRESDLYIEIVDDSGIVVPDGEFGEIAVTTLTRRGMPFIRYKTGDYSRWLTECCSCGSVLKRLDKVGSRDAEKGYLNG